VWLSIVQAARGDPTLDLDSGRWWAVLGLLIALSFALPAPPWRPADPRG
jgi:hypothetical protein